MKKIAEKELEAKIAGIMKDGSAAEIVALLKNLQDASGLKVCQNPSPTDASYKKVE